MEHDALGAHARDELGLSDTHRARPIQAALASAASFATGAALPAILVSLAPMTHMLEIVSLSSLLFLAILGSISARAGGANIFRATLRVTFWGALAMAVTALIGRLFGMAL
jgi:VIT1/CCC1 family predicted Fe2+/Mn2+ transporter